MLLPIINSHIFNLVWIDFWLYVKWNYEFTKVIFFNVLSWIIIFLFFLQNFGKKIIIPKIIYLFLWILIFSTIFSDFPLTSLFWETWKWHWSLMFLNLIWLFIVFINLKKKELENILKYVFFWSIFVLFFWIKEYYFPTFDYWDLSNRAIWTFWHPNYLALYLLVLIPIIIKETSSLNSFSFGVEGGYSFLLLLLSIFLLFLTKSVWWIFIFIMYFLYIIYSKNKEKIHINYIILLWLTLAFLLWFIIFKFWLYTKLNSFVSRFYIWKTTVNIIFSDIKNVIFWVWADTLSYMFSNFKAPELYIFENFWYVADRPHNLVLNLFYHFWIWWLIIFTYFIFNLFKKLKNKQLKKKNIYYFHGLILFLFFTTFNFSSISVYLIITLILSIIYNKKSKKINWIYNRE